MQIFLGGTVGHSTWRKDIAIPILEAAGVTYFDPQLGVGEWTPEHQKLEAAAKKKAVVWLFVITGESRGVASLVESAYRLGRGGKLALAIQPIEAGALFDGRPLETAELNDLNRGRAYLEEVANENNVPVFTDIVKATRYALEMVNKSLGH